MSTGAWHSVSLLGPGKMNTNTETKAGELTGSRHTPGPWHVGTMNDALFIIDQPPRPAPSDAINDTLKTRVVAKLGESHSEGWAHAETEANARLIAATPELFEAAKESVANCYCAKCAKIRAIIARVEGGAS